MSDPLREDAEAEVRELTAKLSEVTEQRDDAIRTVMLILWQVTGNQMFITRESMEEIPHDAIVTVVIDPMTDRMHLRLIVPEPQLG